MTATCTLSPASSVCLAYCLSQSLWVMIMLILSVWMPMTECLLCIDYSLDEIDVKENLIARWVYFNLADHTTCRFSCWWEIHLLSKQTFSYNGLVVVMWLRQDVRIKSRSSQLPPVCHKKLNTLAKTLQLYYGNSCCFVDHERLCSFICILNQEVNFQWQLIHPQSCINQTDIWFLMAAFAWKSRGKENLIVLGNGENPANVVPCD